MARPPKKPIKSPKIARSDEPTVKPDRDWFEGRMSELGISKAEMSRRLGVDTSGTNILWRILEGVRPAKIPDALVFAAALQTSVRGIVQRLGYEVPTGDVKLIGVIRAGGYVSPLPPRDQKRVPAPDDAAVDLVALQVDGAHDTLAIYDQSILYYEPSKVVSADAFGRLAVLELGDHPAPIVGRLDRARIGTAKIVLFGSTGTIESEQLISASPVRWIKAG